MTDKAKEFTLQRANARREHDLLSRSLTFLGINQWKPGTYNPFIMLFDKTQVAGETNYVLVDLKSRRPQINPKPNVVTMAKLNEIVGYRIVVLNDELYVLGGVHAIHRFCLGVCNKYDPCSNTWTRKTMMNRARTRFTASIVDNKIIVCGGEVQGGRITDSVEIYSPENNTWREVRRMPQARADHAACSMGGRLFVSGGIASRRGGGTNSFWLYNPSTDHWSQSIGVNALPNPRHLHCMVAHREVVYCFGGIATHRFKDMREIEIEDHMTIFFDCTEATFEGRIVGRWRQTHSIREGRCGAGTIRIGNDFYVFGGHSYPSMKPLFTVDRFNTKRKAWYVAFRFGDVAQSLQKADCCVLRVPTSNKEFSTMSKALNEKWVLW